MRIYFLRHADAMDGADDAVRPLSAKGRQQCRELGRWMQACGVEFDAVFASPLVRARETAECVLKASGISAGIEIQVTDVLLNDGSMRVFSRWLKGQHLKESLLLVGHAPTHAERAASLLGMSRPEALKLPKAGLVCVETDDYQTGVLKCFVTPKLLA
jgi:phosphohistidine phosphatase